MTDDVRVRLSAEGQAQVRNAFRQVERDSQRSSQRASRNVDSISRSLGGLRRVVGLVAAAFGAITFGRLASEAVRTADEIGKLAQVTGTTAETLSVLKFQSEFSGGAITDLRVGLVTLGRSLTRLRAGNEQTAATFRQLGLSVEDVAGLDTGQAFARVAEEISKLEDGAAKTTVAKTLLGDAGARLIPLLNDLGQRGFADAAAQAELFGQVVDTDLANATAAANDSLTAIRLQVTGLARQFVTGFAPAVTAALNQFSQATAGTGIDAMRRFGEFTGQTLRVVIAAFQALNRVVQPVFQSLTQLASGGIEALAAAARADFTGAGSAIIDGYRRAGQAFVNESRGIGEDLRRIVEAAFADPPEVPQFTRTRADLDALAEEIAEQERRQQESLRARQQAEREAARLREQEERRQQQLAQERFTFEQRFLELEGRSREARLRALDQEIAGYRELLEAQGEAADFIDSRLGRFRDVSVARIDFDQALRDGQVALDELDRIRQRIRNDAQAGLLTQFQAEQQILAIEQQRIEALREIAEGAQASARALGDPQAIASAERLLEQVRQLSLGINQLTQDAIAFENGAQDAFRGSLESTLTQLGTQITSLSGAVRAFANTFVQQLQRIASEILARRATFALLGAFGGSFGFGGGGVPGFATGGYVRGPGTKTSDSIPAYLSNREFVVRASVVEQPGMLELLTQLNRGGGLAQFSGRIPRFNAGGLVDSRGFRDRRDRGGSPVTVQVMANEPQRFRESEGQIAAATASAIQTAANRNL